MLSRRPLIAGGAAGLAAGARAQTPPAVLRFPVSLVHDRALVAVSVDGKGPFRLMLDSGNAIATTLDVKRAKDAGLIATGRVVYAAGVTGAGEHPVFLGHNVVIGGVIKQRDVGFVGHQLGARPFDGLLPAHLLTTRDSELDFAAGEVRLFLSGAPDRTGFTPLRWGGEDRQIVVDCVVDGMRAQLQVDTGAAAGVVLHSRFVARNGLWRHYPRHLDEQVAGFTGVGAARLVRGAAVLFGRQNFNGPLLTLMDPGLEDRSEIDGLLGMDLLRRYTLGFEPRRRTLWVRPNGLLRDPYRYDRAGFRAALRDGAGVVSGVDAESPAAKADLRVGDRLPGVETAAALDDLHWRTTDEAGAVLTLDVLRSGERKPVVVTLEERL